MDRDTYDAALERCLAELNNAILERRALIALHEVKSAHGLDFFRISAIALFNDLVSHTIKVFEVSKQVAGFWYLERVNEKAFADAAADLNIDVNRIRRFAKRFRTIRNKTHFHIDKMDVLDPRKVWRRAGITGDELGCILEDGYHLLNRVYETRTGKTKSIPDYRGEDIAMIIRAYAKAHPDTAIFV